MTAPGTDVNALRRSAEAAEAQGDIAAAERHLRDALAADPGDGTTVFALAEFFLRRGRFAEAESCYSRLLPVFPNEPALLNSLAVLLNKTGRPREAIELWRKVHVENPTLAQPLVNIGLALRSAGQTMEAVAHFEQAIGVNPNSFDAHYNLGVTYYHAKRYEPALACLETALRLKPTHPRAAVLLAQVTQALCDWDRLAGAMPLLRREVDKALAGQPCAITPWFSLRLPLSGPERKAIAAVASRAYEAAAAAAPTEPFKFQLGPKEKLTIGYISGDFRDHPLLQMTAGMYRRHDRRRFRICAFPVKPPDAAGAKVLQDGCDMVDDLSAVPDGEAARRIHAAGVDILVDISGFNLFMRPTILAYRPAPVQVSWLTFAGTLSGRLYDYIIGDPIVTPRERAADYLEAIAWMPHTYRVNDCDLATDPPPSRAMENLPDDAFVFACFCAAEKIEPDVFRLWIEIVGEIPGAVLWLYGESPTMQSNLRRAAAARGFDPARLVFASRRPKAQHLARVALADLHFDTGTYGAHTTGSDALWAGVPLVSRLGDTFPSRVGASMLHSAGLPELIAGDWPAYRQVCLDLARDRPRLAALRAKLAATRLTVPLFDTARSVRDVESLYDKMWSACLSGAPPRAIET